MSPIVWALRPLRRYAEFSGRSSRAEFWWFSPLLLLVFLATWIGLLVALGSTVSVGTDAGANSQTGAESSDATDFALGAGVIFLGLIWLALIVPTVALQVRRLHDTNRSGWWIGAFYLPYAACIILLIGSAVTAAIGGAAPAQPDGVLLNSAVVLWLLLFLYSIVLLVFFSLPGTEGPNRFGDDPSGPKLEHIFA
jgi:uncharacterized membrane protein YhaH (DUF805 family)